MSETAETNQPTSTPEVIDVESLLAPIPGENPSGESMQYAGLHDEIREARRAEDNLSQGDWVREPKASDWPKVVDLATDALATKTKDLQVCAWLAEAITRLYDFDGLRDGLRLMRGLHERFWETVYPEIDEGDLDARINAVSWMDRQLAEAARSAALTPAVGGVAYSYIDWEESRQFDFPENIESLESDQQERAAALKARAAEEGRTTGEEWRRAKGAGRRAFYEKLWAVLGECWDEYTALDRVLDEQYGRQTPGMSALKKSLEDVRSVVEGIVKEKRLLEPDPVEGADASAEAGGESSGDGAGGGRMGLSSGVVTSRREALRRLSEVAEYFRRAEPHSPVSYLVQRAVRWGEMPLEAWLQDVINNDEVLNRLRETLGLKTAQDAAGYSSTESYGGSETYEADAYSNQGYNEQ